MTYQIPHQAIESAIQRETAAKEWYLTRHEFKKPNRTEEGPTREQKYDLQAR